MRHTVVVSALLATLAGTAIAAGSDEPVIANHFGTTQSVKPHHARTLKTKPSPTVLGAALAAPHPMAQSYRPASAAAPAGQTERTWTGFHVGVGLGGSR